MNTEEGRRATEELVNCRQAINLTSSGQVSRLARLAAWRPRETCKLGFSGVCWWNAFLLRSQDLFH